MDLGTNRLSFVLLQGGGRHTAQAKERALQLVAEMRDRGVERNVHTYTALMNVCVKVGEGSAVGRATTICMHSNDP